MAEEFIQIQAGEDNKYTIKLDTSKNVSDARNDLASIISRQDLFIYKGGCLTNDQEKELLLSDLVVEDSGIKKVEFKKISKIISTRQPIEAPELIIASVNKRYEIKTEATEDKVVFPAQLAKEQIVKTETLTEYFDLTEVQKKLIYENNQLRHGLIPLDGYFERSIFLPVAKADFVPIVPQRTLQQQTNSTYNRVLHQTIQITSNKASAKVMTPFVSGTGSKEDEESTQARTDDEYLYLYAACKVPKIVYKITKELVDPSLEWVEAIKDAVDTSDDRKGYEKLVNVLENYGYFFPLDIVIGGSLSTTDVLTKKNKVDQSTAESNIAAALAVSIGAYSGGGGYSHSQSDETRKENTNQSRNMAIVATGGDPATATDMSAFISSLGNASTWKIIEFRKVVPVIELLDIKSAASCAKLINKYGSEDPTIRFKIEEYVRGTNYAIAGGIE